MSRNPNQLTRQQVIVLGWIGDGTPADRFEEGFTHRITARALESRGLVTIQGHGPSWVAAVTEAGRRWLMAPPAEVPAEVSQADELLDQLLAAGGSITLESHLDADRFSKLITQSMKSERRPHGKKLQIENIGSWREP